MSNTWAMVASTPVRQGEEKTPRSFYLYGTRFVLVSGAARPIRKGIGFPRKTAGNTISRGEGHSALRGWHERYITRPDWSPTVVAVLAPAVSLLVRWPLWPVLGDYLPHMTFLPAVALAAYYGGLRPGLLATLLSALAADSFILSTKAPLSISFAQVAGGFACSC